MVPFMFCITFIYIHDLYILHIVIFTNVLNITWQVVSGHLYSFNISLMSTSVDILQYGNLVSVPSHMSNTDSQHIERYKIGHLLQWQISLKIIVQLGQSQNPRLKA